MPGKTAVGRASGAGTVLVILLVAASVLFAWESGDAGTDLTGPGMAGRDACGVGERVLAVRAALEDPGAPGAMRAVVDLGTDSGFYVMVRGWLVMQLQADLGIVEASRGKAPAAVVTRVEFLQQAIRAIDLE